MSKKAERRLQAMLTNPEHYFKVMEAKKRYRRIPWLNRVRTITPVTEDALDLRVIPQYWTGGL